MRIIIAVACLWLATNPLYSKMVFQSNRDGNAEIYTMDSDGSNQTRLTFNEVSDTDPVWSPDGQQIAFTVTHAGNDEIYLMNADGTNQRNLTRHPERDRYPDWSPDGLRIVFSSGRNGPPLTLFVMDSDGSNVEQIIRGEFAKNPKWSPDGERIAFYGNDIYIVNADGRKPTRLSRRPKVNKARILEGWSPDGQQILYSEPDFPSGKDNLVIATLAPGQRWVSRWKRVQVPGWLQMIFHSASFSADGKSILFAGKRRNDTDWDIYRFRLADRKLTQLTDSPGDDLAPQEWQPPLSVSLQELISTRWGEIKVTK